MATTFGDNGLQLQNTPEFGQWLETQGYVQDASGQIVNQSTGMNADMNLSSNLNKAYNQQNSQGTGWGMGGYGGVALGAGQLGLGVMSYLENQKTADKQRQVMDQQIKSNKFALGTAKDRQTDIGNTFGKKPAGM